MWEEVSEINSRIPYISMDDEIIAMDAMNGMEEEGLE